jgi:16S rRNA processing protein RimM
MEQQQLLEIGYIKKPKGLKGELIAVLHDRDGSFISSKSKIYTDKNTHYSVQTFKPYKDAFVLKLESIDDRNQSDLFKGKKLYITKEFAKSLNTDDDIFLATLTGYKVFNKSLCIGKLVGFLNTKAHDIIQVETFDANKQKEESLNTSTTDEDSLSLLELPWVSPFIISVDHSKKEIFLEVPEELLDPDFLSTSKK